MEEWKEFLLQLETELGPEAVEKWVPKLLKFDAANIYLEPADSFQASWFEEHIRPRLKNLTNSNNRPIKVHINAEKKEDNLREIPTISFNPNPLDSEMILDHYICHEKNIVAYKLLEDPEIFNPIYIYGPKGVGKTHLLMGFAQKLQSQKKRVFFIHAENFTEHVVAAIRSGQMRIFRHTYRDIDALIVEDIHNFSKKWATQEEFFHTFNTLHTAGKQILISANCPPSQLRDIEPRLISRFEWGVSLEILPCDWFQVLKKKVDLWNTYLPDSFIRWLIEKFPDNPVLPLQTLLFRYRGEDLSVEIAEIILKDLLEKASLNALTPEKIVKWIAAQYGITSEDILGKSQSREFVFPRQLAMYFCREKLKLPFQKIGEYFQRDHSTVMSSVKQIQKGVDTKKIDLSSHQFV